MKKTEESASTDERSKNLDLVKFLDVRRLYKTLKDNECILPDLPSFEQEMDFHLRIIFHRHYRTAHVLKKIERRSMGHELQWFFKPPIYKIDDRLFMMKPQAAIVWSAERYSSHVTESIPDEAVDACVALRNGAHGFDVPTTRKDVEKACIPGRIIQRRGIYKFARFLFQSDENEARCVITNLATDKTKVAPIQVAQEPRSGDWLIADGAVEVDVDLLKLVLCFMTPNIHLTPLFFPKSVGSLRKGVHLGISDDAGTLSVIYDRRSEKSSKKS